MKQLHFLFIYFIKSISKQFIIISILSFSIIHLYGQIQPTDTDNNGINNISSLEHLQWISENPQCWSWDFELDNNINAIKTKDWNIGNHDGNNKTPDQPMGFSPIGNHSTNFTGKFYGNNFVIDSLYINRPLNDDATGFIGFANNSKISNLGITNCYIIGNKFVGGLAAIFQYSSMMSYCYCSGKIEGKEIVGGLVGQHHKNSTISNCFTSVEVYGNNITGGLCGNNIWNSQIINCGSINRLIGTNQTGGLVGLNIASSIMNSYATGISSGKDNIGGLIGFVDDYSGSVIQNSYCAYEVNGDYNVGGFIGRYPNSCKIYNCFWDNQVSSSNIAIGTNQQNSNLNGELTKEMKKEETFVNSGWDFKDTWEINPDYNDGYPILLHLKNQNKIWTKPSLLSPLDNSQYVIQNPSFSWLRCYFNSSCILQISIDSTFSLINYEFTINTNFYKDTLSLNQNTIYFWRILEIKNDDLIVPSNSFKFTTGSKLTKMKTPIDSDQDGYLNISEFSELVWLFENQLTDSHTLSYELDNDIDAFETKYWHEGKGFKPIDSFSGILEGNSHKIKHFYNNRSEEDNVSFISQLNQGIVRNIALTDCYINGNNNISALVGSNINGKVYNCYSTGKIQGVENVGGLIGYNNGEVNSCYNVASIYSKNWMGGLIGRNSDEGIISKCYNMGNVTGTDNWAGGLVGENTGIISDCYCIGSVICGGHVAGFVGENKGKITNCYSTSFVNGTGEYNGGFACWHNSEIENCFWNIETSGWTSSTGGTGKTTEQLKKIETYNGWDFNNIWEIIPLMNNGYPQFQWATNTSRIKNYYPNKMANVGQSSIIFEGVGFESSTKIFLIGKDQEIINTDSVIIGNDCCEAIFNFENISIGIYNISVQNQDTTITIKNGLSVEPLKVEGLDIDIIGPSKFRIGRKFCIDLIVTNNSNQFVKNKIITIDIESDDAKISLPSDYDPDYIPDDAVRPEELNFPPISNIPTNTKIKRGQFSPAPIPPYERRSMTIEIESKSPIKITANESPYDVNDLINFYLSPEQKQIECDYEYWRCRNDWTKTILNATSLENQAADLAWALGGALPGKTGDYISVLGMADKATNNDFISVNGNFTTWTLGKLGAKLGLIAESTALLAEINGILYSNIGVQLWSAYKAQKQCGEIRDICTAPYGSPIYSSLPVASFDPNDKYGYRSPSGSRYFNDNKINFTYVIEFENKETASASAQEVLVIDTLDLNVFDIESFKAGSIRIGEDIFKAPSNSRDIKWSIDMRPEMNFITYVTLLLDTTTGVAKWYFRSIDPTTLDWPKDPTAGFLPPNDSTNRGQGSVSFSINLNKGITDDAILKNKATIIFDSNEPIVTPMWSNYKDVVSPSSYMYEPEILNENIANISWAGEDNENGAGVYCFNVFMKKGNNDYTQIFNRTTSTSFDFEYEMNENYSFYVTAIDSAENAEIKSNVPEIVFSPKPGKEQDFTVIIVQKWEDALICNNTDNYFDSYQWYKDDVAIAGETKQFYQESGGLNGSYYVQVTTTDGKTGVSNVIEVGNNTKSVKVFPNPSEESLDYTVEVSANQTELSHGTLVITNVNGQIVSQRSGLEAQMKLNGLSRGVYMVQVRFTNGETFNNKLIVK